MIKLTQLKGLRLICLKDKDQILVYPKIICIHNIILKTGGVKDDRSERIFVHKLNEDYD